MHLTMIVLQTMQKYKIALQLITQLHHSIYITGMMQLYSILQTMQQKHRLLHIKQLLYIILYAVAGHATTAYWNYTMQSLQHKVYCRSRSCNYNTLYPVTVQTMQLQHAIRTSHTDTIRTSHTDHTSTTYCLNSMLLLQHTVQCCNPCNYSKNDHVFTVHAVLKLLTPIVNSRLSKTVLVYGKSKHCVRTVTSSLTIWHKQTAHWTA